MRSLRRSGLIRAFLMLLVACLAWLQVGPAYASAHALGRREAEFRARYRPDGLPVGLTQTPGPALRRKIAARERAAAVRPVADVRALSAAEMRQALGRGPLRNAYLVGAPLPWHRSLRDVNLSTGDLFKSYTDVQVAPARGAGLALQRTYNSDDSREGPFGVGWGHAYDIRMQDPPAADASDPDVPSLNADANYTDRADFFGHPVKYHRDADGLYTPPTYMFDELSSQYDQFLADGPPRSLQDTEKGMDGTVKHFFLNGTSTERDCNTITDRYGNTTTLAYNQSITLPDGRHPLQSVSDPVGRTLTFTWQDQDPSQATGAHHWRITQVQGPTYTVAYAYYGATDAATGGAPFELKSVTLDPGGVNRTTSYAYVSVTGTYYTDQSGTQASCTETGLLQSVTDSLGHFVTYQYGPWLDYTSDAAIPGTLAVTQVNEPGSGGRLIWNLEPVGSNLNYFIYINRTPPTGPNPSETPDLLVQSDAQCRYTGMTYQGGGMRGNGANFYPMYAVSYDTGNNPIQTKRWFLSAQFFGDYQAEEQDATYGPHGNVLSQWNNNDAGTGYPGRTLTTYYNASQYFQKASVQDPNFNSSDTNTLNHTATIGVGASTAGTAGDPDPNIGDRGNVLWARDSGYGDSASPSFQKQAIYTYNQYGQKTSDTNLNGVVATYTYGTSGYDTGNLVQVVQDPGAGHLNRTTTMHYDAMGRVVQSIDPKGQETDFTYNSLGQPLTVKSYSDGGVTLQETVTYVYGADGRTHSVTDNRGTTAITYEDEHYGDYGNYGGRVYSVADPNPTVGTVHYTYTMLGARRTMTLPSGRTWTYAYAEDSGGTKRALPKDDPNSLTPLLTKITDDQGRELDYTLDYTGRPRTVTSDQVYNSGGSLVSYLQTTYRYYNGTDASGGTFHQTGLGRPGLDRVQTLWHGPGANGQTVSRIVDENDYLYDNDGQRLQNFVGVQQTDVNGNGTTDGSGNPLWQSPRTEVYAYDDVNRLASVNYGDGQTQSYTFDAMGNRLSRQDSAAGTTNSTYDAANRLLTAGGQSYGSDLDGNTLTGGGRINTWDSENRLIQCAYGGTTSNFSYGADGLRRSATVSGVTTSYVLDGAMAVQETRSNGTFATYLMGPRGPECRVDETSASETGTGPTGQTYQRGPTRWYVYDGLGSVEAEVDPSGNVTTSDKYDVYGTLRGRTGTATTNHGFVGALGHMSEAGTGLVYMQARYYDPQTGRFASEDPKKDGANWYAYCDNDAVNEVDKDGKTGTVMMDAMLSIVTNWGAAAAGLVLGEMSIVAMMGVQNWGNTIAATILATASVFCFALATGSTLSQSLWTAASAELLGLGAAWIAEVQGGLNFARYAAGGIAYSAVAGAYLYSLAVVGACIGDTLTGY